MTTVLLAVICLSLVSCCLTQTPTQYVLHDSLLVGKESEGSVEICVSRTGDDLSPSGTVFLSTEDNSAVSTQDYTPLDRFAFEFGSNEHSQCLNIVIIDDDAVEFDERFTLYIDGATDGIAGSQQSTEIVIETNDNCRTFQIDPPVPVFYVTPWAPETETTFVYKNTILADQQLIIYLASTTDITDNYYSIQFEEATNKGQFAWRVFKNGVASLPDLPGGFDILRSSSAGDTIEIKYDPVTATVRLAFSSSPDDIVVFRDTSGTPLLTIRHIFARILQPLAPGTFTMCGDQFPICLPHEAVSQSEISQTYTDAVAARAIDGSDSSIVDGVSGTCSVTGEVEDPWLRVDVGKEFEIYGVEIYSVAEADPSILSDVADVEVYVGSCSDPGYIDQLHLCGIAPSVVTPDSDPVNANINVRQPTYVDCASSTHTFGRYVYIRRNTADTETDTLAICEVKIYGSTVPFDTDSSVAFSSDKYPVVESDGMVTVSVVQSGQGATCNSVDLYSEDDTAKTSGLNADTMDFTAIPQASPRTLMFYPNDTMESVDVAINPDTVCEEDETFKLTLTDVDAGVIGTPSQTEITITDNDITTYSIKDAGDGFRIREGDGSSEVTILRSGSEQVLQAEGTVYFRSEETGNTRSDTVGFSSEDTEEEVEVEPIDDNMYEEDTTFTIRLDTIEQCDVLLDGGGEATVTVEDDDSRFYFDDDNLDDNVYTIPENIGTFQIKVSRDGLARRKTVGVSVHNSLTNAYDIAREGGRGGDDFTVPTTSLTFESESDEAYITVNIEDDFAKENGESFDILLTDPEGISQNLKHPYRITVVIEDNDDVFRFQPTYYSVSEAQQSVDVCLKRTGALTKTTNIRLETQDDSAIAGRDYSVSTNGLNVLFERDEDIACTTFTIIQDFVAENSEAFLVRIISDDVEKYDTQATVSINDDPDVFISFASEEYIVDENAGKVTVEIVKGGDILQSVSAAITSSSETAEIDSDDYIGVINEGIRIPSGRGSISFDVYIRDDNKDESNEQFILTLSNPSNGVISGSSTTITIRDDDDSDTTEEPPGISNGVLAGIIAAAVVTVLVAALGIGLFCAYLLRRPVQPVVMQAPQPIRYMDGMNYGRAPYGQTFPYR